MTRIEGDFVKGVEVSGGGGGGGGVVVVVVAAVEVATVLLLYFNHALSIHASNTLPFPFPTLIHIIHRQRARAVLTQSSFTAVTGVLGCSWRWQQQHAQQRQFQSLRFFATLCHFNL